VRVSLYAVDPDKAKANHASYRERHRERLRTEYRDRYYDKEKERKRKLVARRASVKLRIDESMAAQIWSVLRGKKAGRSWPVLVGYTVEELLEHLESHFGPGMTWDNFGRSETSWSIDHVIPKSRFRYDSADSEGFRECWALSNLRPMWWPDNHAKGNRMPEE